jgi:hypothetical protein
MDTTWRLFNYPLISYKVVESYEANDSVDMSSQTCSPAILCHLDYVFQRVKENMKIGLTLQKFFQDGIKVAWRTKFVVKKH